MGSTATRLNRCRGRAECERLTAATDAGAALRKALSAQLHQANSHSLLQDTKIKVRGLLLLLQSARCSMAHCATCRQSIDNPNGIMILGGCDRMNF